MSPFSSCFVIIDPDQVKAEVSRSLLLVNLCHVDGLGDDQPVSGLEPDQLSIDGDPHFQQMFQLLRSQFMTISGDVIRIRGQEPFDIVDPDPLDRHVDGMVQLLRTAIQHGDRKGIG